MFHPRSATLVAYVDGALGLVRRKRVERHLANCEDCRNKVELLRTLAPALAVPDIDKPMPFELEARLKQPATWDREPLLGELTVVLGDVFLDPLHGAPVEAFPGLGIRAGDRLRLGSAALALVEYTDGSQIYVNANSELTLGDGEHAVNLGIGSLLARIRSQASPFTIQTPAALLSVLGTSFETGVTDYGATFLRVLQGRVALRNAAGEIVLGRRQQTEVAAHQAPAIQDIRRPREIGLWAAPVGALAMAEPEEDTSHRPKIVWAFIIGLLFAIVMIAVWNRILSRGGAEADYQPPLHSAVDQAAPLTYSGIHWPTGVSFTHRIELTLESQAQGNQQHQTLHHEFDLELQVLNVESGGGRRVEARIDNSRLELARDGQHILIQESGGNIEPADHPIARLLAAQETHAFIVHFAPDGSVTEIKGIQKLRRDFERLADPNELTLLQDFTGEAFYRSLFEKLVLRHVPSGALTSGTHWNTATTMLNSSNIPSALQMTFERWDLYKGHRCAQIAVDLPAAGAAIGEGRLWLDPELGMVVKQAWSIERRADGQQNVSGSIRQQLSTRLQRIELERD